MASQPKRLALVALALLTGCVHAPSRVAQVRHVGGCYLWPDGKPWCDPR